jgi:hypothetical protein
LSPVASARKAIDGCAKLRDGFGTTIAGPGRKQLARRACLGRLALAGWSSAATDVPDLERPPGYGRERPLSRSMASSLVDGNSGANPPLPTRLLLEHCDALGTHLVHHAPELLDLSAGPLELLLVIG